MQPNDPAHSIALIDAGNRRAQRIWDGASLDSTVVGLLTGACIRSSQELCGFITLDDDIMYVPNSHQQPRHNYYMSAEDLDPVLIEIYSIRQTGIRGQFHTHPNATPWPSPRDLLGWPDLRLGWRYWIVTPTEVIEWRLVFDDAT